MGNELQRYHVIIKGRVQGVGFRYNTKSNADKLGITGWVRNKPDGSVEVLAEGTEHQLLNFKYLLKEGSISAIVKTIEAVSHLPATGEFDRFDIRY